MIAPVANEYANKCRHCGKDSGAAEFCCGGCRAVYQTINGLGLAEFYKYRQAELAITAPDVNHFDYDAYDQPAFLETYFRKVPDGRLTGRLHLTGIHCAGCVWLVERLPHILPGVSVCRLNFAEGNVALTFDPVVVKLSTIATTLHSLGYPSCPLNEERVAAAEKKADELFLLRLGIAGFSAANTMLLAVSLFQGWFSGIERDYAGLFRWVSLVLALPTITFSAWPFYQAAFGALLARRFHIDLPISMAILVAFLWSAWNTLEGREYVYFDSATALVFLLLASRLIQQRALRRARAEVRTGWSFVPTSARLLSGENLSVVPLRALKPNDLVEVLPGERFPSDGLVESGESSMDYSILSGESLPIALAVGDRVAGGALNQQAPVRIRITESFCSSRLGRLLEEIESNQRHVPRFITFTEKVSAIFVLIVLFLSAVTLLSRWHLGARDAIESTLALLIVTCPCALALASPLMMALAVSRAAKRGILIKDVDCLERLNRVENVYFDKTGTLTSGQLEIYRTYPEVIEPMPLAIAGALAALTPNHPMAAAVTAFSAKHSGATSISISQPELAPGRGVSAVCHYSEWRIGSLRWTKGLGISLSAQQQAFVCSAEQAEASVLVLSCDRQAKAIFALRDHLKVSAYNCVGTLLDDSRCVLILSGDRLGAVLGLADRLGIASEFCRGELFPEDKRAVIRNDSHPKAMIGDGFNDGGALQEADVSIAVAGGLQSNLEIADIIIPSGDLDGVEMIFRGAQNVFSTLKRILAISLVYNICGASLAMSGAMNPLFAAVLMPLSSLTVIAMTLAAEPFCAVGEEKK